MLLLDSMPESHLIANIFPSFGELEYVVWPFSMLIIFLALMPYKTFPAITT